MIYLATPIKHEDPAVVAFRIATANQVAAKLHDAGIPVFSPASHSEAFIDLCEVRQPWSYWSAVDLPILKRCCSVLAVIAVPGWMESVGVSAEISEAEAIGMKVILIDRETLDISQLEAAMKEVAREEK